MKIDCELTDEEETSLAMLMGIGAGQAVNLGLGMTQMSARLMNKLFAASPRYLPYDENNPDLNRKAFGGRVQ
jgi:acyl CoA:acetate/3-ketoacid CoA transferase beta subunit